MLLLQLLLVGVALESPPCSTGKEPGVVSVRQQVIMSFIYIITVKFQEPKFVFKSSAENLKKGGRYSIVEYGSTYIYSTIYKKATNRAPNFIKRLYTL